MNAVDTTNGYVMEYPADRRRAPAHRQLHRAGDSIARRQRRVARRHRRKLRPGQRAHLGQRPARHFKRFSAERRGCQQSLQRQKHQPGGFVPRRQQYRPGQQCRRRRCSQRASVYLGHRQCHPDAGARDNCGSPRQRFDVRRAARLRQRRAHRHEHQVGHQRSHGGAYVHRGTNWINAAPFFFKKDDNIPAADKNPQLHRYTAGGEIGGPIIKNKLFGFVGYQHLHISDQETGDELLVVPPGLNSGRPAAPMPAVNQIWLTSRTTTGGPAKEPRASPSQTSMPESNPVGFAFFTASALPGEPGQLPDSQRAATPAQYFFALQRVPARHSKVSPPTRQSPILTGTRAQGHCGGKVLLSARSSSLALRLLQCPGIHCPHGHRFAGRIT